MPGPRARVVSACLSLSLCGAPAVGWAGPEAESPTPTPIEGPQAPTADPVQPPPPTLGPTPAPVPDEPAPGIEFAPAPPEANEPTPSSAAEPPPSFEFPDPGTAPSDGVNMLVLSGTTLGLTVAGVSAGLVIGLDRGVELEWLLPSTIVPAVGLLAFSGGGLYLGIQRARAHRRWEIGYRVIGLPQGGGLLVGGSFTLLGALGLLPTGVILLDQQPEWGAALIAVGATAAIATPIMFVIGARNQRRYLQTGGWKRKPLPPLPPTGQLELRPLALPIPGGVSLGAVGRF